MRRKAILVVCVLCAICLFQSGQPVFNEYPGNPVFAPQRAYYPTVIYDKDHFCDVYAVVPYYKMWYSSASGIALAYSADGITWYEYGAVSGLIQTAHHAHVIYDKNGFGGSIYYKMWFWDTSHLYSLNALKYAESSDGITWTWSLLTQDAGEPLVTGTHPDWNRGTYGPIDVFYNSSGSPILDDDNVWNNTYVMYYDGTTGGVEQVGLGYSADGLHWKRYKDQPVLPNTPGGWDSNYTGFGTVVALNGYHFFYSGGKNSMHEGIGYAFSHDGITWEKKGIIFHVADNVPWRKERCYTPSVLGTLTQTSLCFDMWFSGDDGSNRTIGYAQGCIPVPGQAPVLQNTEREIQNQMMSLARFNHERCCEKSKQEVTDLLNSFDFDMDPPEYRKALDLIDQAEYYCAKAAELTASGNTIAGNYCALESCKLYFEALDILKNLANIR
jgi:hypothetical protein